MDEAISQGAIALFNDKYQAEVRVLSMGQFSKELCGGTHVDNTQDIGLFKITAETGVASGVRRIEAVAGDKALDWYEAKWRLLKQVSEALRTTPKDIERRVDQLLKDNKALKEKATKTVQKTQLTIEPKQCGKYQLFFGHQGDLTPDELMRLADQFKQTNNAIICLFGGEDGKPHPYVIALNKEVVAQGQSAKKLLATLQSKLDIKGGGRDDLIRGVCKNSVVEINDAAQLIKDE